MAAARSGNTDHPLISRITLSRMINQALGGAFVAPWEVDELPVEFIDAVIAVATELPQIRSNMGKVEDIKARWRAGHPTYRK